MTTETTRVRAAAGDVDVRRVKTQIEAGGFQQIAAARSIVVRP